MKKLIRKLIARIDKSFLDRLQLYSLSESMINKVKSSAIYIEGREKIWDYHMNFNNNVGGTTYIEFGVHEGYSIRYFQKLLPGINCKLIGLDCFEGLPSYWRKGFDKGHFNVAGSMPEVNDTRVVFIKGYFNDTWINLKKELHDRGNFVVNFDAEYIWIHFICTIATRLI